MQVKKSWLLKILLLIVTCLLMGACSKENTTEEIKDDDKAFGGTLKFAFNAQPPTLDPTGTTATATRDIARNIFEQLVTFDSNLVGPTDACTIV